MSIAFAKAQTQKEKLEQRKAALQREIDDANARLSKTKKEAKNVIGVVNTINRKINSTQEIIQVTNQQATVITQDINSTSKKIATLKEEIKVLKAEYADMIVKAYKSNNDKSRLMFLLSSENFLQAYKRVQYLKAYANYRQKQADQIDVKTKSLEQAVRNLEKDKQDKQSIIAENQKQKAALDSDKREQNSILAVVKKDESKFAAEIRAKNKERASIDAQIRKIIEADIAKSNEGKADAVAGKFYLSPEAKALANSFSANRGRLPWPVEKGLISMRYGSQPSPILASVTINSNGLRFQTPTGTQARTVFDGEVVRVEKAGNGILTVHVRHGNYTSVYGNLRSVNVSSGQDVKTRQVLGTVFTDRDGISELKFVMLQDTNTMDPAGWIQKN